MIRIICRLANAGMAANVGGAVLTKYRTFDVVLPEVEKYMREAVKEGGTYAQYQIVGTEILAEPVSQQAEVPEEGR